MADLVIRYVNGRRTMAIHQSPQNRMEAGLHDKTRERRIPIPAELADVLPKRLLELFQLVMGKE